MNNTYYTANTGNATIQDVMPDFSRQRVVERKIGRATFIVSTRFNGDKEKDIVSTISRLIQYDSDKRLK